MKRQIFVGMTVAIGLCGAAQSLPRSVIKTDTIHSRILDTDREYTVYLPAGYNYEESRTYPVLYLLHGMSGDHRSWTNDMQYERVLDRLIINGEADEMIVVTPNAGGADIINQQNGYFNIPGWNYEDFFFSELLPEVEKKYRCGGSKGQRAIAGFSMGGGGTASYAQRHPDMFSSAYAMSALMDIPEYGAVPVNDPNDKLGLLTQSVRDKSCTKYVLNADDKTKEELRSVKWFVDCGDDDFLLDRNIEFFQAMRNAGIPVEFRVKDGVHDAEYWYKALYSCFPFVSRNFSK